MSEETENTNARTSISLPTPVYEKLKKVSEKNRRTMVGQVEKWSDDELLIIEE